MAAGLAVVAATSTGFASAAEANVTSEAATTYRFTDDLLGSGATVVLSPDTQQLVFQPAQGREIRVNRNALQISVFHPTATAYPDTTNPISLVDDVAAGGLRAVDDLVDSVLRSDPPTSLSACETLTDSTCERRFVVAAVNNNRLTLLGAFDVKTGLFAAVAIYKAKVAALASFGTCLDDAAECVAPPSAPQGTPRFPNLPGPPAVGPPDPDGSVLRDLVHDVMKTEVVKEISKTEPVKSLLKTEPIKGLLKP